MCICIKLNCSRIKALFAKLVETNFDGFTFELESYLKKKHSEYMYIPI